MSQEVTTSVEAISPDRRAGSLLMASLIGMALGATVALLCAPASGSETRRVVSEKAKKGREKATGAAQQGRQLVRRSADHVNKAVETGKKAYRKARRRERDVAA